MAFAYTILPPPLHSTANAAVQWFIDKWGIRAKNVRVEQPIDSEVELRPTFSVITPDYHTLCVEVSASAYANTFSECAVQCLSKGLPVKLFVAMPQDHRDQNYAQNQRAAKRAGIGILQVGENSAMVIQNALSLSLMGLRAIELSEFPKKYRHSLYQAEQTFRDGNPAKGCSQIYDELEKLFRRIAKKTHAKGWWANAGGLNVDTVAWATLIDNWERHIDRAACPCRDLCQKAFVARIHGVTPYRNDTGHSPTSQARLKRRDQELRTRFESAVDLLRDILRNAAALHL